MNKLPQYLEIGARTYKIKRISHGFYSVWECRDICSLKYLGDWTKQQLIKCWECKKLI